MYVMLLLLVLSATGLLSISSSKTGILMAGHQKHKDINRTVAESGIELSRPIIEHVVYNTGVSQNYSWLVKDQNILKDLNTLESFDPATEFHDDPLSDSSDADVSYETYMYGTYSPSMKYVTIDVDIDYIMPAYSEGAALEFASGYQGLGKGSAKSGQVFYSVNSYARDLYSSVGAKVGVGAIYKYAFK